MLPWLQLRDHVALFFTPILDHLRCSPSSNIITRISIQTAGVAFGGTGLCSHHATGVDISCAKHLSVEFYTVIYAANRHTYYY